MGEHTPGPWVVSQNGRGRISILAAGNSVAGVYALREGMCNAKLIASAPALAAEVERLREVLSKLCAEVSATLGLCEPGLREMLGNTNVNVLTLRWNEAKDALARQEAAK